MDIRDTEEFKLKYKEILKQREAQELSAETIITQLKRTEELRKELYSEAEIGKQGIAYSLVGASVLFVFYASTKQFSRLYPKAYKFVGCSYTVKGIILLVSARIGIIVEQQRYEIAINPILHKEYMSSFNYSEQLLKKRTSRLDYLTRFHLVTGLDLPKYYSKIHGLFKGN
jgi:hypothetical protein